jgi:tRNA-uridine 2-sulfurtransferase
MKSRANKIKKEKIIVAMSGGIDSSAAAALLKKNDHEVTGLYLRLFKDTQKEKQVKKIAEIIGMPLIIKDVRREFKKLVVDYFLQEYKNGRTPNPCVVCNREIKFRFLFQELTRLKADYVATGHYARLREAKNQKSKAVSYKLFEAKDKTKDQSYFLYTLKQKQLAKIIFPLGDYKKEEVKKMAKKLELPIKEGDESQNVCFIAEKYPDKFLKKYLKIKNGEIVDSQGKVIGQHHGLALYTLGQRRGMNIGGSGPYYVIEKNFKGNRLIVTNNPYDPRLSKRGANLKEVKWVSMKPKLPIHILAQTRYHNPKVGAIIRSHNMKHAASSGIYKIKFEKPQRAVTPGQSAVFYNKKGEIIGGGIIK